jgi:ribonuclease D
MRDDIVMELAAHPPRNVEDLKKIRNIPSQALSQKNGTPSLLDCIAEVQKSDESSLPEPRRQKKLPRGIGPTVDLLKVLLKQKCEAEGVAQKLVANVSDLELLAADDQADVTALKGWRKELFGSDAIALKQGKLSLSVSRNQIIVSRLDLSSRPE